ncbi:hypothetical protein HRbin29_01467 [bacterium HR29]|jgi:flagellar basal body-associated protein FliL|nr:hypothetical protein HRbin29_01467 [bacterium HR29]
MKLNVKVLAVAGVLLAGGFWFYVKPNYLDAKTPPVYTEEQLAAAPRPTVRLEERVLNLKAPPTAPHYVKTIIALEFEDPTHAWLGLKGEALAKKNEEFAKELEPELHRIWDVVTSVIGAKTIDEVSTSEGREALKEELKEALNHVLHDHKVERVYFDTFVTQ